MIDCDPGHDDAIAILLALASPEVELLGVTTTFGNQTLEKTTVNALRSHLEQNPGNLGFEPDASRQHWSEMLMSELAECRRALDDAVAKGKKFRFLIVS